MWTKGHDWHKTNGLTVGPWRYTLCGILVRLERPTADKPPIEERCETCRRRSESVLQWV